jgi:hypothetical protein
MSERKVNLASDDAYIQYFNKLKATHDTSKKVNIKSNNINDSYDSSTHRSNVSSIAASDGGFSAHNIAHNITGSNKVNIKINKRSSNLQQVSSPSSS